ncbi:hypothetical protein ACPYPG_34310 [Streptomyces sp. FR-108]|uniref:hypothetical protein n=1 Tax=Streptomyces sp. FR-108 TaxID=3416665 RepID=UPI003CEC2720
MMQMFETHRTLPDIRIMIIICRAGCVLLRGIGVVVGVVLAECFFPYWWRHVM